MWGIPEVLPEPVRQKARGEPILQDQQGRSVRFFADLLARQRVLVHTTYSACSDQCPPAMGNLLQALPLLGPQGQNLRIVSLTLTPLEDTPKQLRALADRYQLPADWLLLTGTVKAMDQIRERLGLTSPPEANDRTGDLSHLTVARLCDSHRVRWGHVNLLLPPRSIARMIRYEMA
jgi:protein SCO1/2